MTGTVQKKLKYWRMVVCIYPKSKKDSLCRDILMRKFSKVVKVFVGTTEESKPSFTKNPVLHRGCPHVAVDEDCDLVG